MDPRWAVAYWRQDQPAVRWSCRGVVHDKRMWLQWERRGNISQLWARWGDQTHLTYTDEWKETENSTLDVAGLSWSTIGRLKIDPWFDVKLTQEEGIWISLETQLTWTVAQEISLRSGPIVRSYGRQLLLLDHRGSARDKSPHTGISYPIMWNDPPLHLRPKQLEFDGIRECVQAMADPSAWIEMENFQSEISILENLLISLKLPQSLRQLPDLDAHLTKKCL